MREPFKIYREVLLLLVTFVASFAGLSWLLRSLGATWGGVILLLLPTALVSSLAWTYSYVRSLNLRRGATRHVPPNVALAYALRILGLTLLAFAPALTAVLFLFRGKTTVFFLLIAISALISLWSSYRIKQEARRFESEESGADLTQDLTWPAFERAFRVFVFGLLLAIPGLLAIFFFLVHRDVVLTTLFAIFAAGIAFWVIPKIKAEIHHSDS